MAESLNILGLKDSGTTGGAGKITFPDKLFEDNTDYVKFSFYKYKGPFSSTAGGGTDKTGKKTGGSSTYDAYNQVGQNYESFPSVIPICLFMPEDISTGYQTAWGGKGFTNVAANILRGGGRAQAGDAGGAAGAVGDLIKAAAGSIPTAVAEQITGAINGLPGGIGGGNITTNDLLQGSLGVVLNPNTELMFSGFEMRTFSLRFKMAPRNLTEAKNIRNIIYTFKKVMLPSIGQLPGGPTDIAGNFNKLFGGGTSDTAAATPANANKPSTEDSNANYIGVPGLCQVQFMKGANVHPYLPQFKVCAITGVDVNYTPDGSYATYGGKSGTGATDYGSPVATELTLSFQETKLVYSEDIISNGPSY